MMTAHIRTMLPQWLPGLTFSFLVIVASIGAFTGGLWAEVGIGGAIIIFLAVWVIERTPPRPAVNYVWMAGFALPVMTISALDSSYPMGSWYDLIRIFTFLVPLLLLTPGGITRHIRALGLFALLPVIMAIAAFCWRLSFLSAARS